MPVKTLLSELISAASCVYIMYFLCVCVYACTHMCTSWNLCTHWTWGQGTTVVSHLLGWKRRNVAGSQGQPPSALYWIAAALRSFLWLITQPKTFHDSVIFTEMVGICAFNNFLCIRNHLHLFPGASYWTHKCTLIIRKLGWSFIWFHEMELQPRIKSTYVFTSVFIIR